MKIKIVNASYKRKSDGELVVKQYLYREENGRRTKVAYKDLTREEKYKVNKKRLLIKRDYTINKSYYHELKEELIREGDSVKTADLDDILSDIVNQVKSGKKSRTEINYNYIKARLADDKLQRFFANLGRTPEEILAEVNTENKPKVLLSELIDLNNWHNNLFISPSTGRSFTVHFDYYDDVLIEQ